MNEQHIRLLDDLEAEFARVAAELDGQHRRQLFRAHRPHRAIAAAAAVLVVLLGGAYAVPTTRAAMDDLSRSFAAWVSGDDARPPGRALRPADDAPDWLRAEGARVIAENDGVRLYVSRVRSRSGIQLRFTLGGGGAAIWDSIEGWRHRFDRHAVVVLGPGGVNGRPWDEHGRFALLGLTARSVDRIELRYAAGPSTVLEGVRGGFVLMADGRRALRDIVAYDRAGHELERTDVSHIQRRAVCFDERGCRPGRLTRP